VLVGIRDLVRPSEPEGLKAMIMTGIVSHNLAFADVSHSTIVIFSIFQG